MFCHVWWIYIDGIDIILSPIITFLFNSWSQQDIEQEPPARPALPQELLESQQNRYQGHGYTESPYEVWEILILGIIFVKYNLLSTCFQVVLCLYFRESTATLLILLTEEGTASLTSLMWKHQETHLVGTDTLIINRVHKKSYGQYINIFPD